MPGGDRSGPMGAGPMTGRGMGICRGVGQGVALRGRGLGRGGRGRGRGWNLDVGSVNVAPSNAEHEKQILQQQVQQLQDSLTAVQNRLNELDESSS